MIGKVETYNSKRGFGFIQGDDGQRYFVSFCNVKTVSGGLLPGYTVEFSKGKGNRAENVRFL